MLKKIALIVGLAFTYTITRAQTADAVYDQYLDFNIARSKNATSKALLIGESLLPNVTKLPAKSRIILYYNLAKLYEDSSQPDKAITYYEIVAAAEPDYFVPHLALGYLYLGRVNEVYTKMQAIKDPAERQKLMPEYKNTVLKALPHLEKAQACDPEEQTLTMIKFLYTNIKDTAGLSSLNTRLAALSKNCVTVLSE
jgi:tetratricopeptide (TPR) repeat protein